MSRLRLHGGFESKSKRTNELVDDDVFLKNPFAYRHCPSRISPARTSSRAYMSETPVLEDARYRGNIRKFPNTRIVRGYIQKVADDLFVREDPIMKNPAGREVMPPFVDESQQKRRLEPGMGYSEKVWEWLDKLSVPVCDLKRVNKDSRKRRWVLPYPSTASDTVSETSSDAGREQKHCRNKTRAVVNAYRIEAETAAVVRNKMPTHEMRTLTLAPSASRVISSLNDESIHYPRHRK